MTPDTLQTILSENFAPWILDLGLTVTETAADHTTLYMPLTPQIARVGGIVCGQALMAMADTAMVLAAIANAGELKLFATTNLDTQFLRPGSGTAILCRADIIRAGRAMVFVRAKMTEETSGKPVATASSTLFAP